MAATKRSYVAVIIALLLTVGIPGYLTMYTSPDPDYSEPRPAGEATDDSSGDRLAADSPPAPVFPDLRRSTTPQPAASPSAAAAAPTAIPTYDQPAVDGSMPQYISSCQPTAGAVATRDLGGDGRNVNLRIALAAPKASLNALRLLEAAELVETSTAGRVRLKFFTGGVMGGDARVLQKMQIRQLQGAFVSSASLQEAVPALGIYRIPALFRSAEEVAYLRELLDPALYAALRDAGYVSFCFVGSGFARIMSQEPIRSADILPGKRAWVPEGDDINDRFWRALGVSPSPLPLNDVMAALQTGLVDIVSTTAPGALSFQWYTQVNYMTDLPIAYQYGLLVMDASVFRRIAPADQQLVAAALNAALYDLDSTSFSSSVEAFEAVAGKGVQIVPTDPAFRAALEVRMRKETMEMIADGILPKDLTLQVLQILADYRAAAP